MLNGKKGKFYLRFVIAAALLIAAVYSYSAFAAVSLSTPSIANTNGTTISSALVANASPRGGCL
ncbi:hypothetical protein HYU16_01615 [Candidatus Woesearchaeota archaeon]|nr:hypothetical protein [Candidatus Woesearchaeota archaeon]